MELHVGAIENRRTGLTRVRGARVGEGWSSFETSIALIILGAGVLFVIGIGEWQSDKRTFRQRMVDQIKHPLG